MSKYVVMATWDDAPHLSEEDKADLLSGIPEYQRDARSKGVPQLGSGAVFPIPEEDIKCTPFAIPSYWALIGGMDFGWDHPFAAAMLAHDRDTDTLYLTHTYRKSQATPLIHAEAIRPWGFEGMPWAWPHDGQQHGKNDGVQLAQIYRGHRLNLLTDFARFEDGSYGLEAGIMLLLEYMQSGRFKVFSHLSDFFEEFRMYHRDEGVIVKEREDLISAVRYAVMCRRYAELPQSRNLPKMAVMRY